MSKDRRDRPDGVAVRSGPLANPVILGAQKNRLLDLLERRRDPRHPRDVKERLVSRWKQTLALSNAKARQPMATPAPEPARAPTPEPEPESEPESEPAPEPASRREPPRPPNPLRNPGRIVVNRIRRENEAKVEGAEDAADAMDAVEISPEPVLAVPETAAEPEPEPVLAVPETAAEPEPEPEAALEPDDEPEPEVAAAPEPALIAEPVVVTKPEPTPAISVRVSPPRAAVPSPWMPGRPSLTKALADVAVQTAGTVLVAAALKVGQTLRLFG